MKYLKLLNLKNSKSKWLKKLKMPNRLMNIRVMDVKLLQFAESDTDVLKEKIMTFAKNVKRKWPRTCHIQCGKSESQNIWLLASCANMQSKLF